MKTKLHYVLSIAMILYTFSSIAQNSSWKKVEIIKSYEKLSKLHLDKNKVQVFELDLSLFKSTTTSATLRGQNKKGNTIISIPGHHGELESFNIYEAPVFSPELAAKYPNIKSYVGVSRDNSGARLRMSVSLQGVQTMISYIDKPTVFMQPLSKNSNQYVLYNRENENSLTNKFECKTIDELNKTLNKNGQNSLSKINEGGANDQTLQKFRIAISTTSEYTDYHDDENAGNGDAIADALAAINASLSRVNEVFEIDMAVTFELIDATQLIYNDADTDPYSDANVGTHKDNFDNTDGWSLQLQNTLTNEIGNSAYDIGHLFGATGGGGNAGCIGCVCQNPTGGSPHGKGSAYTSPSNAIPEGDSFDINYVIHEIGHQMGANHTWAFETEGTGVNSEPGSGTTIMAYAGVADPEQNNVEQNSDDYFHYHSIKQILDNLDTKSCQTTEAISNNPPSADAGNDYNIPRGTAYILKGSATDLDGGDNLTYCWEQIDSGLSNYFNFGPDLTSGPMNRSLPPTNSPDRYIPKFNSVLAGNTTRTNPTLGSDWETVSSVARTLNWALTVRDRSTASSTGGQTSYDTMQITVEDVTPFTITNNPVSWAQGTNQTIEWVVGQTANGTINCQNVNILLSTDGGLTFPTTIASNTPNDGSFTYTVPAMPDTANARLLVEAADNIFYDVSDFDFSISSDPDFFIVEETLDPVDCNATTAVFHFEYVVANGFSENTVFSASGNPGSSTVDFSPANLSASGSVTMTISDLDGVSQGNYTLTVTGTSTSITKNKSLEFPFFDGLCVSVAESAVYKTSTTLVQFNTINQSSAKPFGYSDYTSITTNINRNNSYDLTVNVNTDGNWTTRTKVWIDWNQNCSFDDFGEEYDLGDATNVTNGATTLSPLSITVPIDAAVGNTTMRVSTKFDTSPTSCENGFDGEVEDYTLNILSTDVEYDTSITLVQFNTISQSSTKPSDYSDYSSVATEISRDDTYDLTANVTTDGNFTTATKVWIDWNQNSNFNDTGEAYDLGEVTNATNEATSNSPLSISVPIDAILGNTIMRVATRYIGSMGEQEPIPSANGFDGEVEDYTLTILPTAAIEESGFDNLIVHPNPNNGKFNINLNGSLSRDIIVEIFTVRGELIYKSVFEATGDLDESIDLNNIQSGIYILSAYDGLRKATKKIVVN
ncbi:GEVED domain-containing protein [Flavivirga aquimarina]|uniref:GEVED domain-containing protein n=1 Tax=Flavivirga aquimarina TaxID=2027862 RepID=A0ABT8W819_9FLAO|nr:GEVED domain-containing protein [Flavivirga aquimarina]MDO5969236.1 GEVED domain-containing protein [Flavivirga aquimarina]